MAFVSHIHKSYIIWRTHCFHSQIWIVPASSNFFPRPSPALASVLSSFNLPALEVPTITRNHATALPPWASLICVFARHGFVSDIDECKHKVPGAYPISVMLCTLRQKEPCIIPAWYGCAGRMHGYMWRALYPCYASVLLPSPFTNMLSFQDTRLALLHIPLHLYSNFLQPILQLILPSSLLDNHSDDSDGAVQPPDGWDDEQPFINISVTPVECSVVCSRRLVDELFLPVLSLLDIASRSEVNITSEDFVVMQVDGEGLDADRRVLELTGPLALAGM